MTNWFHDVNLDEELDQSKTSTIQMTDLVDDDILYNGRGNEKDSHWFDDHNNIIIYNWCSTFYFFIDVAYKSYRVEKWKRGEVDPYDMVYHNLPKKHLVLCKVKPCGCCNMKRFPLEGPSFCCRQGKVKLHMPDVPDELRWLLSIQTYWDALYFRKHIQYFNSHFSFVSLGANLDRRYNTPKGSGVYTLWIHGQVYNRLDQLVHGQEGPRHMQLYFYDIDETIRHKI
jgi:hypothetical protein